MQTFVIDFETSGTKAGHVPAQVACAVLDADGAVTRRFVTYIQGPTYLDPWVLSNMPHLTLEKCNAGMTFADAMAMAFDGVQPGDTIVAHNAGFDVHKIMRINAAKAPMAAEALKHCKVVCTMNSTTNFCKLAQPPRSRRPGFKWPKLTELAAKLKIDTSDMQLHDAAADVELTRMCLDKLAELGLYSYATGQFDEVVGTAASTKPAPAASKRKGSVRLPARKQGARFKLPPVVLDEVFGHTSAQ